MAEWDAGQWYGCRAAVSDVFNDWTVESGRTLTWRLDETGTLTWLRGRRMSLRMSTVRVVDPAQRR